MAFENVIRKSDPLYPVSNNQDERLLIEYNGIMAPESEYIFYGIEGCPLLNKYPFKTYKRMREYPQDQLYEEICYFRPVDLILYLNDGNMIDESDIKSLINYGIHNYDFSKITYLAMDEAIKKLIESDFVKGITFILSNRRKSDEMYLNDIFGSKAYYEKCSVIQLDKGDNIIDVMKDEVKSVSDTEDHYTSIITNEYKLILDICNNYKEYNADTMFYLLRNHSQNMKQSIKGDSVVFDELHTDEIVKAINGDIENLDLLNINTPIKSKFARFAPRPLMNNSPSFMVFGEQSES